MDSDKVNERHILVGKNQCTECEKKAVINDKNRPNLIECECGHIWHSYPQS